jgi:hypothetical protein
MLKKMLKWLMLKILLLISERGAKKLLICMYVYGYICLYVYIYVCVCVCACM